MPMDRAAMRWKGQDLRRSRSPLPAESAESRVNWASREGLPDLSAAAEMVVRTGGSAGAALTSVRAQPRITGLSPGSPALVKVGRIRWRNRTRPTGINRGQGRESTSDRAGVHHLQGAHVQHPQEQAERPGAAGAEQVLPSLPAAHPAPGNEVGRRRRGVAQLVEHWSPKPAVAGSSPVAPASPSAIGTHTSHHHHTRK